MVGYGTKELDLRGKIVVPGFIDSHVHLIFAGLQVCLKHHYWYWILFYFLWIFYWMKCLCICIINLGVIYWQWKQMMRVELRGINSKDEFVKRVKEAVKSQFPAFLLSCNILKPIQTLSMWIHILVWVTGRLYSSLVVVIIIIIFNSFLG